LENLEKKWGEKMANPYMHSAFVILPSSSKKKIKTNGESLLGSIAHIYAFRCGNSLFNKYKYQNEPNASEWRYPPEAYVDAWFSRPGVILPFF
jgi:hypothetical protein